MPGIQRFALLVVGGALIFILSGTGGDLWRLVTTKRDYFFVDALDGEVAGWSTSSKTDRGAAAGPFMSWWVETGFVRTSGWESPGVERFTVWTLEGEVQEQVWIESSKSREKQGPPWWWEVEAQSEPTAPWLHTGQTPEEWVTEMRGEL